MVLGVIAVVLTVRPSTYANRLISLILVVLWLWVGLVFGFLVFGFWTPVIFGVPFPGFGYFFGITYLVQSLLFLYFGIFRQAFSFRFVQNVHGVLGLILILFAMGLYGLVGFATGYPYPLYPLFGTAPCPVAIYTMGLFLWAEKRLSPVVLLLPIGLGLIGIIPILAFGLYADIGMLLSGVIGLFLLYRHWKWSNG